MNRKVPARGGLLLWFCLCTQHKRQGDQERWQSQWELPPLLVQRESRQPFTPPSVMPLTKFF
jgi:hypothetical protein